jgi:hypothetical protein
MILWERNVKHTLVAIILLASVGSSLAQTSAPPASTSPGMPAVATPSTNNSSAPAAGANSFTEAQARSRIEAAGYSDVSKLEKDKDGVWRGHAAKSGTQSAVGLDYQGNVVSAR